MEKTGQKTYKDPTLNKIVQEKAAWNRSVSALINDLIHFKKSVNGWPSKYYKERTRITAPIPVDLAGILNQIAGEFQEISNRGNSILAEQAEFSKGHMKKKTDQTLSKLDQMRGPIDDTPKPTAPGAAPDLSKQLTPGAIAFSKGDELIKLAIKLEDKYFLESQASNPITRFLFRLFNPNLGFGEAARMRRLRRTLVDSCADTYKALKSLQAHIVKSNKGSIKESHNMMTSVWSHWNIVYRLVTNFKKFKPGEIKNPGGIIDDPELRQQRSIDDGQDPDDGSRSPQNEQPPQGQLPDTSNAKILNIIQDYQMSVGYLGSIIKNPQFRELVSTMERLMAMPKKKRTDKVLSNFELTYGFAIGPTNQELGTSGRSFQEIVQQHQSNSKKEAQELVGGIRSFRHKALPGATSGSRLEIYESIGRTKKNVDKLMDLLQSGYDQTQIDELVHQIHREMTLLRTLIRSLLISVDPKGAPTPFF